MRRLPDQVDLLLQTGHVWTIRGNNTKDLVETVLDANQQVILESLNSLSITEVDLSTFLVGEGRGFPAPDLESPWCMIGNVIESISPTLAPMTTQNSS